MWFTILISTSIITLLYFYLKKKYSYWSDRGVPTPRPLWLVGNIHQLVSRQLNQLEIDFVQQYGKVYGFYFGLKPSLVIADPELVKQVTIRDFQHFVNRLTVNAYHELWNKNLFSSNDEAWKRIRTIASPTFASGKLRGMQAIMGSCVDKLDAHLQSLCSGDGELDAKKVMAGFTIDVISSTAFATETNANADSDSPFVRQGRAMLDISPLRGVALFILPKWLLGLIGIETFFKPEPFNFFINVTKHIVAQRQSGDTGKRNDLVQMLIDASVDEHELHSTNFDNMTVADEKEMNKEEQKASDLTSSIKRKLTDSEIIANCIFFLIAGYETTASTLAHTIYELARNPDIQQRLCDELHSALDLLDDENSSEYFDKVMNGIPYLEACIKETLRRYPPVSQIQRVCSKEGYELAGVRLFKGQIVHVSLAGIHLNEQYHPEPFRYKPDRFLPENRDQLVPYSYLPFSLGPRNCIAMRFAYQEIKLCLARIVRKFKFSTIDKTPAELQFKVGSGLLISGSIPIKVSPREID